MSKHQLEKLPVRQPLPGFFGRFVHSESMTFAYWRIEAGSSLPEHSHPHEQVVNQLEGELELTVDGARHHLVPGDVLVIPGGKPHSARAISECRVLDVFHPVREEYR